MEFKYNELNWGDTIYYININAKNRKVDIKAGTLVGIMVFSTRYIFRLEIEEDKEIDILDRWCSKHSENLVDLSQSITNNFDKNDLWSCFDDYEED